MSTVVAVVTGANKGIGKAIVQRLLSDFHLLDWPEFQSKSLVVYLTSRDKALGLQAVTELSPLVPSYGELRWAPLDVTKTESISALRQKLKEEVPSGEVQILINNAGIAFSGDRFDEQVVGDTLAVNYYGLKNVTEALLPLMNEESGRIVNVSSTISNLSYLSPALRERFTSPSLTVEEIDVLGSEYQECARLGTCELNGWPKQGYAVSKIMVNAYTKLLSNRLRNSYACCPGWVKTDLTGNRGRKVPLEGADTPVWLALSPADKLTPHEGHFFKDRECKTCF